MMGQHGIFDPPLPYPAQSSASAAAPQTPKVPPECV